ncbi:AAA domain-containing protein [Fusarium sp. LHS14.1]|nr:AAA domain-containing protein [Fusarium sp. LHS14.1]
MGSKLRGKQLVSYGGTVPGGTQAGQRFMIDFSTYQEHQPTKSYSYRSQCFKMNECSPEEDQGSQPPEIYPCPTMIPGFDLRRKEWVELQVDQIRDVVWNDKAFENLAIDENMKKQILALVSNQPETEKSIDLIDNKRNGLIMLLRGPAGTGKTFTAESVAEMARKPLYAVACSEIGTKPEQVEMYLQSAFHLAEIWDCVVVLDNVDKFLEQRTHRDLDGRALASAFLHALEYYEGIVILTARSVHTLDEAFKSRIQLELRYDELKDNQRKQIWQNRLNRLKEVGEGDGLDGTEMNLDELAQLPMNGWEIINSITVLQRMAKRFA